MTTRKGFAKFFKDLSEQQNYTYESIWEEYYDQFNDDSVDKVELDSLQFIYLEEMHKLAIQCAKEKSFTLIFETLDRTQDGSLYDFCDGHTWYWPQFMAQLLDELKPRKVKGDSRFDELNKVLKENGYDPEPGCITRIGWCCSQSDFEAL